MISIITCTINPDRYTRLCENLRNLLGNEPHEFIPIRDARSMAEGYNRGIRLSNGEVIIFCHDDIEILSPDFRPHLLSRLKRFDLLGVAGSRRLAGQTWAISGPPYSAGQIVHVLHGGASYVINLWTESIRVVPDMKVMDGVFLAGNRGVFESVPFDDQTFGNFHFYDLDFTVRAAKQGFKLAVCNDLMLFHWSMGNYDARWYADAEKFEHKHRAAVEPVRHAGFRYAIIHYRTRQEVIDFYRNTWWAD